MIDVSQLANAIAGAGQGPAGISQGPQGAVRGGVQPPQLDINGLIKILGPIVQRIRSGATNARLNLGGGLLNNLSPTTLSTILPLFVPELMGIPSSLIRAGVEPVTAQILSKIPALAGAGAVAEQDVVNAVLRFLGINDTGELASKGLVNPVARTAAAKEVGDITDQR